MFDVNKIRNDFPVLKVKMSNQPLIYFDNSATSLKPKPVIDAIVDYYSNYSTNAHRGDYELSYKVDTLYEAARANIAKFINAANNEIVFTSGATAAINLIANLIGKNLLKSGDEIILNHSEHASNILPWYKISREYDLKIVFCKLNKQNELTLDNLKAVISNKTKVIAFAHITNTIGDIRDVEAICEFASANNIYTVVDGSQSIPHLSIDVATMNCDFFVFSGHKMCGPTGIGVMYGKIAILEALPPYLEGGGMNSRFDDTLYVGYKKSPTKFEAGTPNIAGVLGLSSAVDYLISLGMAAIHEYECELKAYAVSKIQALDNITIYNANTPSGILLFNINEVFAQDAATHLNSYGIAIRAGHHCAKLLKDSIDNAITCRASFYFYNTKAEIDVFVDALAKGDDYLEAIF